MVLKPLQIQLLFEMIELIALMGANSWLRIDYLGHMVEVIQVRSIRV